MGKNITKMFFANLRRSDVDFIEYASRAEDSREQLQENLIQYLKLWEGSDWVDDEKIWLLGLQLRIAWSHEHKENLKDSVRVSVEKSVADLFISGFLHPVPSDSMTAKV